MKCPKVSWTPGFAHHKMLFTLVFICLGVFASSFAYEKDGPYHGENNFYLKKYPHKNFSLESACRICEGKVLAVIKMEINTILSHLSNTDNSNTLFLITESRNPWQDFKLWRKALFLPHFFSAMNLSKIF